MQESQVKGKSKVKKNPGKVERETSVGGVTADRQVDGD